MQRHHRARRRRFIREAAFARIGVGLTWREEGVDEEGVDTKTGEVRVRIDSRLYRPTEVDLLLGDPRKAREKLGWEAKVQFETLVDRMMKHDLALERPASGESLTSGKQRCSSPATTDS